MGTSTAFVLLRMNIKPVDILFDFLSMDNIFSR